MVLSEDTQLLLAKPASAGVVATAIDKFWFRRTYRESLMFGIAVLGGVLIADASSKKLHGNAISRGLETRLMEVGIASAGALALDAYAFQQEVAYEIPERVVAVAVSEMSGEWIARSLLGQV